MEFQSLVSFQHWTFIAQILNLFIQMYLFKRFLFKPIKEILAKRQAEVDAVYDEANRANEAAQSAKSNYEAHLDTAHDEAAAITARALTEAQTRSDELIDAARKEAQAIRSKADADIAQERKKAVNEMKDELSSLAVNLAEKITQKEIREEDHEALIEGFIRNLGDVS